MEEGCQLSKLWQVASDAVRRQTQLESMSKQAVPTFATVSAIAFPYLALSKIYVFLTLKTRQVWGMRFASCFKKAII